MMNKRERIIVIFTVAVGIYAFLDFFVISGDKGYEGEKKIAAEINRINDYTASTQSQLSAIQKSHDLKKTNYLMLKAESEWPRDPFVAYTPDQFHETVSTEELPELSYTGFIKAGNKVLAIVNGMEYTIGETLTDIGYKVSSITPYKLVLLTEFNKQITLDLEEN